MWCSKGRWPLRRGIIGPRPVSESGSLLPPSRCGAQEVLGGRDGDLVEALAHLGIQLMTTPITPLEHSRESKGTSMTTHRDWASGAGSSPDGKEGDRRLHARRAQSPDHDDAPQLTRSPFHRGSPAPGSSCTLFLSSASARVLPIPMVDRPIPVPRGRTPWVPASLRTFLPLQPMGLARRADTAGRR